MEEIKLGRVIAERTLSMTRPGQPEIKVVVQIGMPQRFGPEDYRCPFRTKGRTGDEKVRFSGGVDALQAILLTIKLIGRIMDDFPRADGSRFSWLEDKHCGFPIIYWRYSPKVRQEMKKMGKWMRKPMRKWFKDQKTKDQKMYHYCPVNARAVFNNVLKLQSV